METFIELKEMKFYAYHGVSQQEKDVGNYFTVDLRITAPLGKALHSDDLKDTINYAEVYSTIKKVMQCNCNLIEKVAGNIVNALQQQFPCITAIDLKVSKLNPPFGGDLAYAAVVVKGRFD